FRGRLGYACLNTVLRSTKPPSSKESIFSSRTLRLATIREKGVEAAIELARANINDIIPMLHWNVANNIRFMRLSCEMLPFASHNEVGWDVSVLETELRRAGDEAKKLGVRLTLHPGQFVQLGTPNQQVLENSIREFEIYCKMLDLMGSGPESVMILHGGGSYGDQAAALERIENTITTRLSASARSRLVLENDEISYSAEELLPLCEKLDVPLVFDWHHDLLRPSSLAPDELLPRIINIWQKRGIKPKFHLSEPRAGAKTHRQRRAHSDRCVELPTELPEDADLMIEAKDKEQAVLELYRIYNLFPVDKMVLRPHADDVTMATAGRRT
ncbi:UV-endonuclease UvdE, partial [Ceraceosorus guamensis]